MRPILPALSAAIALAGCGNGDAGNTSAQATEQPAPKPTGPAPRTPVTNVTPPPGDTPDWIGPRSNAGDPATAPYADLLDKPVVNTGAPVRR